MGPNWKDHFPNSALKLTGVWGSCRLAVKCSQEGPWSSLTASLGASVLICQVRRGRGGWTISGSKLLLSNNMSRFLDTCPLSRAALHTHRPPSFPKTLGPSTLSVMAVFWSLPARTRWLTVCSRTSSFGHHQ